MVAYTKPQQRKIDIWTLKAFCLSSSDRVLPLNVRTPCDYYAWGYRELVTLLTLSENLAEGGFEPLAIGSMRKNLIIALS